MSFLFSIFDSLPYAIKFILYIAGFIWAIEIFCLPFNINRLIMREDKCNKILSEIFLEVKNHKKVIEGNENILALLLGNMVEKQQKGKKEKYNSEGS